MQDLGITLENYANAKEWKKYILFLSKEIKDLFIIVVRGFSYISAS